jgi:hypothetical protein
MRYHDGLCPEAEDILRTAVLIYVNEFWTNADIKETVAAIRKVAAHNAPLPAKRRTRPRT